jgi:UDP-N-acetylglucosamine 2-epimerase (non-hydrolysing)
MSEVGRPRPTPGGHVDLIAGARPNFMKIAPIIRAFKAEGARRLDYRFIHTGQHYDYAMSGGFLKELGLPEPDVCLNVGSGSHAEQTGAVMTGYERALSQDRPRACVVVGDVNSTMACAIVARKMGVPVAHVEAGIRSGDWTMPEEINRVVADALTNWFFTTSVTAGDNLRRVGIDDDRIFFVGNTMIDTLLAQQPHFFPPPCWQSLALVPREYFVVTLHRPGNVDGARHLADLLGAVARHTVGLPVVFPVHPRTAGTLRALGDTVAGLHYIDPLGYREFNFLVQHAKAVITDSGGITEETTVMGVPCLTLRDNTERPETVTFGTNELVGTNPANLGPALARVLSGQWKKGAIPEKWDGRAGERIVAILERLLA